MKSVFTAAALLAILIATAALADRLGEERDARQAELDAACEAAREKKIVEERAKHVEECVATKMFDDRETCEQFYSDYGESAANQAPLFYDLPQCEAAHEYRTSYRSSDRKSDR